jgi:hypothetical protein
LTENEVFESTSLTLDELKTESFMKIMENR